MRRWLGGAVRKICGRAGFRGAFLLLVAVFDVFYGWYLVAGAPLQFPTLIPERAWGMIFLAVAAVLAQGAFVTWDRYHFALAVALKAAWAFEFFRLEYRYDSFEWTRGSYFLALALIVVLVSAWPEPP